MIKKTEIDNEELDFETSEFDNIDMTDENDYLDDEKEYSSTQDENILDLDVKKWSSEKIWDVTKTVSKKWKITYSIDVSENTYKMFEEMKKLLNNEAKRSWDSNLEISNDKIIATCILTILNELSSDTEE